MENIRNSSNTSVKSVKTGLLPRLLRLIGPAIIVAAGIVGPGTVTTASAIGAKYGYALIWCAVLSPILAYILHEPALRWALKTNTTLIEGVRDHINNTFAKVVMLIICFMGLAYQTANCIGAAMALNLVFPSISLTTGVMIFAAVGTILSLFDKISMLEKVNAALVGLMILAFLYCVFASKPNIINVSKGIIPSVPLGSGILVVGLIGTTVCSDTPFGMSSLTKKNWNNGIADLGHAVKDLKFNMILIALVTVAIITLSATVLHPQGIEVNSAADMAAQLTPFLGHAATVLFALGLASAGFSSVIYNASVYPYMVAETFRTTGKTKYWVEKGFVAIIGLFPIIISILLAGVVPVIIIVSAQAMCTLLLPVTVTLIFILMNKKEILGDVANTKNQNISFICLSIFAYVTFILGMPSVIDAFKSMLG